MTITYSRYVPKTTKINRKEAQELIKEVRIWKDEAVDVYFQTSSSLAYRAFSIPIDRHQAQLFNDDENALWQFAKDNIPKDLHINSTL